MIQQYVKKIAVMTVFRQHILFSSWWLGGEGGNSREQHMHSCNDMYTSVCLPVWSLILCGKTSTEFITPSCFCVQGRIEYDSEGKSYYEGDFVKNVRHGWGVRQYPSGNLYKGMWFSNVRHGQGTMKWIDRNQIYTGQWENGIQVSYW